MILSPGELESLLNVQHRSPHQLLGMHPLGDGSGRVKASLRPIAGTRPRGDSEQQDQALEADLLADPKERAEHVMLIDLARNDIGRIAQIGTVKVTDEMIIERYSHVMHIVSNVEGTRAPGVDAIDVFKASFPAGTVTGAPKVRAMEIIAEFEPIKRGLYSGAVGYLGYDTAAWFEPTVARHDLPASGTDEAGFMLQETEYLKRGCRLRLLQGNLGFFARFCDGLAD
mgnify:CR=1 FL=1